MDSGKRVKVLISTTVFPDGSGDFAFVSKMIANLLGMGFLAQDIFLVLGIRGCDD